MSGGGEDLILCVCLRKFSSPKHTQGLTLTSSIIKHFWATSASGFYFAIALNKIPAFRVREQLASATATNRKKTTSRIEFLFFSSWLVMKRGLMVGPVLG